MPWTPPAKPIPDVVANNVDVAHVFLVCRLHRTSPETFEQFQECFAHLGGEIWQGIAGPGVNLQKLRQAKQNTAVVLEGKRCS